MLKVNKGVLYLFLSLDQYFCSFMFRTPLSVLVGVRNSAKCVEKCGKHSNM